MNVPSQINPCQTYFVHLSDTREPILGTMFSKAASKKIDKGFKCLEAILPPYQMTHANQCFPASGLRYWYKVNKNSGQILPNSLFSTTGKVFNQCSGVYNILEYVIYSE